MVEAEKLKRLRKVAQVSQEQLAQAIGVSRQTLSHWENGQGQPDEAALRRIAQTLQVSAAEFGLAEEVPAAKPRLKHRRLLWVALLALAIAAAVFLLLPPAGLPTNLTPEDFQTGQTDGWVDLRALNAQPRRIRQEGQEEWRLDLLLTVNQPGGMIQEVRAYRYSRDWLGRMTLKTLYKQTREELKSYWGTTVLKARSQYNSVFSVPKERGDGGFGVELITWDPNGQPVTLRLWLPVL